MATQTAKEEHQYQAAFRQLQDGREATNPAWFARLRESAMDRFEQLGFPSVKDEEWQYTNVTPVTKFSFKPSPGSADAGGTVLSPELEACACVESQHTQSAKFIKWFAGRCGGDGLGRCCC
jgi:hypothetical protein